MKKKEEKLYDHLKTFKKSLDKIQLSFKIQKKPTFNIIDHGEHINASL